MRDSLSKVSAKLPPTSRAISVAVSVPALSEKDENDLRWAEERESGDRPIVVSYASSPPAEVMFAEEPIETAPTGVVTDGCYRQIEFAGILDGTDHPDAAGDLIDFMLTPEFQEGIPTSWLVFPANLEVELPEVFTENTELPAEPTSMDTATIAENREEWLRQWRQIVMP